MVCIVCFSCTFFPPLSFVAIGLSQNYTHTRSLDLYRDAMMVMIFVLYSPSQLSVLNKVDGCEKTKEKKTKKIQSSHDAKLTKIVCFLFNFAGKQCTCFCRNVC